MTGDAGGGGSKPPQPPAIDVDGIWQAHLETCSQIERAFRETLGLAPEVDLRAFGERFAMAASSERPAPVWPPKRPTEQALKREVLAIEKRARLALDGSDPRAMGDLVAALHKLSPEVFRALPEAVFVQLEARRGTPSAAAIIRLRDAAAQVAALVPQAAAGHAGTGRPQNITALSLAVMLARDFETLTGKPATFHGTREQGGKFGELVAAVFDAAGIDANPVTVAKSAVRRMNEAKAAKSGMPK